jgi:CDP-paratose 2-epimerase
MKDKEVWTVARADLRANGRTREGPVLITGGAGFIGTNVAHRLAANGARVLVYDNLSRAGVEQNIAWLEAEHGTRVEPVIADIRDEAKLRDAVRRAGAVFHFAAQVAVTTSMLDPAADYEVNAGGTVRLLEAIRACATPPTLVFTSTNKVYGPVDRLPLEARETRYQVTDGPGAVRAIDEHRPLDFHTPYGCSKGAVDQYVLDYARSYGLRAVVFRMSCIYGPHQFGTEDQGWVAHFLRRAIGRDPITIYGDGRQVRDILYVDDLVDALLLAERGAERLRGHAFNIGGGYENAISLVELLQLIATCEGRAPDVGHADWRTGDQRYYVSDYGKFERATGWRPRVGAVEGIERLHAWLARNRAPGAAKRRSSVSRPLGAADTGAMAER